MKNYILMLGIAAVALGSYAAYAGNSATMTVTATIAHDVSLIAGNDLDFGTITINPTDAAAWDVVYREDGTSNGLNSDNVISADDATLGTFTANIPNPSACNNYSYSCGGLSLSVPELTLDGTNGCSFGIKYSGSGNTFNLVPDECYFESPVSGTFEQEVTITYHP
ncbi:MAG: hypothetical protein IJ689_04560 [Alphaproteobacteria bacterium]|nr:hypothetical protein [Alphaproteobacteria bacterium]